MIVCLLSDMVGLPILIGASLIEVSDNKVTTSIFQGKYTDMGSGWYPDVG
jgi:hypothetical protein